MAETSKIHLRDYVEILYKRRFYFLSIFFLMTTIVTIISYFLPKVYVSTALILIEKQQVIKNMVGGEGVLREDMKSKIMTYNERIISTNNLLSVIKKLDLDVNLKTPRAMENMINKIRSNIDVTVKGINLFEITYEDEDPKLAMLITRTLTDNFIESTLNESRTQSHSVFDFIKGMAEQYKKNLEDSENTLENFKKQHIGELPGEVNSNLTKLSQYDSMYTETKLALDVAFLKKKKIEEQIEKEKPFINPQGDTRERLKSLEAKLAQLMSMYTENYPEVKMLKKIIENTKKQISGEIPDGTPDNPEMALPNPVYQKLKESLSDVEIEITSLNGKLQSYQNKLNEYSDKAKSVPEQEQELTKISRDYKVNEEIYQMLLRRLEEARITKELQADEEGEKYRIVDPPLTPINPIKPNRARIMLIGLLLGVGAGIGMVVLLEYFDHSIRELNDAKSFFQIPILGTIPEILLDDDVKRIKKYNIRAALLGFVYLLMLFALIIREFLKYNL